MVFQTILAGDAQELKGLELQPKKFKDIMSANKGIEEESLYDLLHDAVQAGFVQSLFDRREGVIKYALPKEGKREM